MASRHVLGSAYQGLRSARRQAMMMARTADLPIPFGSMNSCFPSTPDGSRFFCSQKKDPDSDLTESIKQKVLHGLQEALAKGDGSVPKLSIIKAGVNSALKESLKQFRVIDDNAEQGSDLLVKDAVKDFVEDLEDFLQFQESDLSDSANGYIDPRHRAFMRYVAHCVSKSVEEGFEDAVKRKQQPDDGKTIDNEDQEADQDWTFTEARFTRQNRRFRVWAEKQAQKRRDQHAGYTSLMNEKAAKEEMARKEARMEQIKEGVLGLKKALGEVGESVDAGFEKSQQASDDKYMLDLLNSQTLLLALGVLEDVSRDLGYLMFKEAQEAKRLKAETLWVYTLLDKMFARLPFNPTSDLKSIVKQFDESRSLYPFLGCVFVLSRSSFTPLEWVEIARISNDDWVLKWTQKLKETHDRSKAKKGKGPSEGDDSDDGTGE